MTQVRWFTLEAHSGKQYSADFVCWFAYRQCSFFWLNQSKVLFKLFHFFLGSMLIIGFFAPSAVMKQYAILSLSYLFFYMSFKNKYALYFSFLSLLWLIVNLFYKE